ncbi:MAG TPA: DUF192 domain-containing protein [Candidatus Binataceae bacterium]|nr:DUF192 domain-containing protein [Candidatus Binataceae bacterium]
MKPARPRFCRLTQLLAIAAVAMLLLAHRAARADQPAVEIAAPNGTPRAVVQVEIADSEGKREFGLMYRKHLDENAGMIFVFAQPKHLTFWMKNTEIRLDMIFAGPDGKINGIIENATPLSERTLSVDGDSQYVLEVNGGFCKRHGIKGGDTLKFEGFEPRARD